MTITKNRSLNIRSEAVRQMLLADGWTWVTVVPRGERKGTIRSKHSNYALADHAARGKDRDILQVAEAHSY